MVNRDMSLAGRPVGRSQRLDFSRCDVHHWGVPAATVDETDEDPPVSVFGRAMSILHSFDASSHQELTLAQLTEICRLPKPTVHRLLGTLGRWGMVERTSTGFRLGLELFELGMRVPRHVSIRDAALPYLLDLHEATKETVQLAVLDGTDVVFLAKVARRGGARSPSRVGGRVPAHCTGVGKALLAHAEPGVIQAVIDGPLQRCTPYTVTAPGLLVRQLESVRETGLSRAFEESSLGISCVASPVFDAHERAVAAISISGSATNFDSAKIGPAVRTVALGVSRALCRADSYSTHLGVS